MLCRGLALLLFAHVFELVFSALLLLSFFCIFLPDFPLLQLLALSGATSTATIALGGTSMHHGALVGFSRFV